ncbi:MAG TPA: MYXO-CTERM sorting domain-containing protein [Polyangiaceae bacterium]|jgi:MYXO-CTERM domain-containing protein
MAGRSRRHLLVSLVLGLLVVDARPAAANGRFPLANQIAFSPADSNLVVLRTTFGVLVSHDSGASWQWICESAIGIGTAQEDPTYGITQTNAIVGALWQGLSVSPDVGCTWAFGAGALAKQRMVDLVVRADAPDTTLALTGNWMAPGADGGGDASTGTYDSRVLMSADDGASWNQLGTPIDPAVVVTTIEVAKGDPSRIYVSGVRGVGPSRTASLFVSDDKGTTWTERPTPFAPDVETAIYIAAVDPSDADLVYVRTDGPSRLLVTADAGKTFSLPTFQAPDGGVEATLSGYMFGFALSPDGSKIYVGGVSDGVFMASKGATTFAHQSSLGVQCLAARGAELWACSAETTGGFIAGVSVDDGASFSPKLHLNGVDGVLQCAPGATVDQCQAQLPTLCPKLGGCVGYDSGAPAGGDAGEALPSDGGADAEPPVTPPATPPKGGCSVPGTSGLEGFTALLLFGGAATFRRRKRPSGG